MKIENITFNYAISNNGPSTIKELTVKIQFPTLYISKSNQFQLVDTKKVDVRAFSANKMLEVEWRKEIQEISEAEKALKSETFFGKFESNGTDEGQIWANLPKDRTIYFDCSYPDNIFVCSQANFIIQNVKPGNEIINITMTFGIDLSNVGE